MYAYTIQTGALLWQHHSLSGGMDSPYGIEPLWESTGRGVLADGVLYLPEGHEFAPPLFHGAQQLAINTTNGEVIWSIDAFNVNGGKAISDGVMTALNAYDNQIYAYGSGPSKTTVIVPNPVTTVGSPIVISGTVNDISAGSEQQAVAANFPNGLPCVSDNSMSHFMEAVYMQQQMPNNTTGVSITIDVLDSNGNYRQIGSTTSDASGFYTFTWIPDIKGDYTVYATFAGSQSYYGSTAEASFYVSDSTTPAPTAIQQANFATTTDLMMYTLGAAIAIITAIAVAVLLLRKRP